MLTLQVSWFDDTERKFIRQLLEDKALKRMKLLTSFSTADQDDDTFTYMVSRILGEFNTLTALNYLLVDNSGPRPWIVRKPVKAVLDLEQTLIYIDELKAWLIGQAPAGNKAMLIQTQTILKYLTEIKYE